MQGILFVLFWYNMLDMSYIKRHANSKKELIDFKLNKYKQQRGHECRLSNISYKQTRLKKNRTHIVLCARLCARAHLKVSVNMSIDPKSRNKKK